MVEHRAFIESPKFPVSEISEASGKEKGPGRPPHWEMVFWWTRKPQISARAVIAGCLLPENTSRETFLSSIGIRGKSSPHRNKPLYKFENVKLLDPFAGFGSIPLEAIRLGLSATAVELLPVAYVFLKAVLEYPLKYGERLVKDVESWGKWVTERLKEDPEIKELYDDDVLVYIGSWEIKCPNCDRWTPIVGNWWLLRVKGDRGYKRLAWMKPKINGDEIEIEVVDLNKELGDRAVRGAKVDGNKVTVNGREYRVPESNIEARREQAICLLCNQPIRYFERETGRHIVDPAPGQSQNMVWYIKLGLAKYNEGNDDLAKPRLLVKAKALRGNLEFEPSFEEDQKKLRLAKQKVEKLLEQREPDIPSEHMAPYDVRRMGVLNYGFTKWYQLFNSRQLLTLVKLVKLIREAGKIMEEQEVKKEPSRDAFRYVEAVTTYLGIALCKEINYYSLTTRWDSVLTKIGETLSVRGIAMMWNWTDANPFAKTTGTWVRSLNNIIDGLNYLISNDKSFFNYDPFTPQNLDLKEIKVRLDDATVLSKLNPDEKFNLIVSDPPYYDDVPYTELSDLYYVWLKRVLSDVKDNRLVPRFSPEAFFEKIGEEWIELPTQWERFALSEVSLNRPRLGTNATMDDGVKHFQHLLNASFTTMACRLRENGLIVTYYAHTDPDAWKALLEAGWKNSGLRVTNAFPIATESVQSVISKGKLSLNTSIVVVWRKGSEGSIDASSLYEEMLEEASRRAKELIEIGIMGRDLLVGTLAAALASATKYREVKGMGKMDVRTLVSKYIYPATLLGLAKALARKAELKETVRSPDAMFYLIVKFTSSGAKKKIIESTDARIFSIGTSLDLNKAVANWRILKGEKQEGARVAKAKSLALVEPTSTDRSKLAELLEAKEVGLTDPKIKCTVDALHVLEYYAVTFSREEFRRKIDELKAKYPSHVEEAISMAKIMARVLSEGDVEKILCTRVTEHMEPSLDFSGGEA